MKNKNKSEIKGKPKYPLLLSVIEIPFFILIAYIVINDFACEYFTDDTMFIMRYVFFATVIIGSIFILVDNISGKGIINKFFRVIGRFYRHPKVYWKQHVVVLIIFIGLILYNYIPSYNNNSTNFFDSDSNELCGENGAIYYCLNLENVVCEDNMVPVFDDKSYKCIDYNTFKHDYKKEEYDFICTKKYRYNYQQNELNNELIEAEKACLYNEITKETDTVIADIKKDLPNSFDIRSKVKIKAGNQGNSNACYLWSRTKALEISAQLKGIDYQFLLDFEKQINDIKMFSPAINSSDDNVCFEGECIPGNKKDIYTVDFNYTNDYDTEQISYYPNFSDNFKIYRNEYYRLVEGNSPDFILNSSEYSMLVNKAMIMKYGSIFAISTEYNKYINPMIGHQMLVIGWDDSKQSWLALNSWGDTWKHDNLISNGDGTVWIKYSDNGWGVGGSVELLNN